MSIAILAAGLALGSTSGGTRAARIRDFANRWLGTPYLWGGEDRSGIDCSGYVQKMFRELFHAELPRTTKDQINLGHDVQVRPAALEKSFQVGDLIFYIDREGIPSHVVCFAGAGMITHSVSGRGVVIEPVRALWGRRIVARRLFPAGADEGGELGAIPAAGPIVPQEIPCPPSIVAKPLEVRQYKSHAVDIKALGDREICEFRALADALRRQAGGSPIAKKNADALEEHSKWLESIDALKGFFDAADQ